jgi:hypothetical protein
MSEPHPPTSEALHIEGVYQSNKPAAGLAADLQTIAALDKESETQIQKYDKISGTGCVFSGLFFIGAMVSLVVAVDGGGSIGWVFYLLVVAFISCLGLSRWAKAHKEKHEKDEFPDYRYLICGNLAKLLSADMAGNSPLEVTLNLREKPDPPARIKEGKTGKATWNSVTTTDCFLNMSGRFLDGTKFDFSLAETVDAYGEHFPYRAMSGKTKTKLKARKSIRWLGTLRLRFKEKRYAHSPGEAAQIEQLIQLPEGAKLKKLDVKDLELSLAAVTSPTKMRHKVKMSTDIPAAWDAMPLASETSDTVSGFSAQLFLNLYQILNSSKSKQS